MELHESQRRVCCCTAFNICHHPAPAAQAGRCSRERSVPRTAPSSSH
jgi:hypothetical protein